MVTGYNYSRRLQLDATQSVREAIYVTVINYMHYQLGWSLARCEQRVVTEEARVIPKGVLDMLTAAGWVLKGARLLDVGAGQGGTVLEALERGADACGVEPGDEFRTLARMRLEQAGMSQERILAAAGEALPFPDNSFDFVISLQVLQNVPDPFPIMQEIFRVLKPGGQAYIACENYLSFREQHYRLPWLPMLPKPTGGGISASAGTRPGVSARLYPLFNLSADLAVDSRGRFRESDP